MKAAFDLQSVELHSYFEVLYCFNDRLCVMQKYWLE